MVQARTLDEAQIKRVQRYLRTRRNSTRDSTIFTFAFNTGLRAKELAALCVGDAYDACLLYTSPSPRDLSTSRMPSSA